MVNNQFAIYRVDMNKKGSTLKHLPYQEVRAKRLPIRIEDYKPIHMDKLEKSETSMDLWKRTKVYTEVSDVLVMNQDGLISCHYVDEECPYRITGFIQLHPAGAVISMDTREYEISGKPGKWMVSDTLIIDGKQYYLLEHQVYRKQTSAVILDCYGKIITETVKGFDDAAKKKILEQTRVPEVKKQTNQTVKPRMEFYQKFFENGTYERRSESGTEKNYNMVDGCVNNLKESEVSSAAHRGQAEKKPKKRTSVIKKLHEKQVAIAKRTGRPVPKYLEKQIGQERVRK